MSANHGGILRRGKKSHEDMEYLLFTFRLFDGRCDISYFSLKSSANFVTQPSVSCVEKKVFHQKQ